MKKRRDDLAAFAKPLPTPDTSGIPAIATRNGCSPRDTCKVSLRHRAFSGSLESSSVLGWFLAGSWPVLAVSWFETREDALFTTRMKT
jgi:hypothetical protein